MTKMRERKIPTRIQPKSGIWAVTKLDKNEETKLAIGGVPMGVSRARDEGEDRQPIKRLRRQLDQ